VRLTAQAAIDRDNEHEQNEISGQAPNPRESQPEFEKKVLVGWVVGLSRTSFIHKHPPYAHIAYDVGITTDWWKTVEKHKVLTYTVTLEDRLTYSVNAIRCEPYSVNLFGQPYSVFTLFG